MRRKLIIAIPVVVILLVAAVVLFLFYGTGTIPVQRWIASQLGAVTDHYLNPRLSFKALHYQYPLTATLDDVRLVADDPAKPGHTVNIFVAKRLTLEMAQIPRPGQPLRIQKLILDRPEFRVVAVSAQDSRVVGYSGFLKEPDEQPATAIESKLSDVFDIRLIEVVDGLVVYDPRTPGEKPLKIDQISFRLNIEPLKDSETGWYAAEMDLERKPVFSTHLAGRMNTDTMVIEVEPLLLKLALGRDQDHYLPPQIQTLLKDHEVSGNLVVEARGSLQITDWRASTLKAQVTLASGHFAMGEHRMPLDRLKVTWTMAKRHGILEMFDADVLGGRVEARGEVVLNGPLDGHFDVHLTDIQLQQCLRNSTGGEGKYRGDLSGKISWEGPLTDPRKQSHGGGTLRVVDGDLSHIPVLSDILAAVTGAMDRVGLGSGPPKDTAEATFTFEGDRVNLGQVFAVTQWTALRGRGDIYFDSRLDLLINAGSVEKVESLLGSVGLLLGKMSDGISAYTVTGTLGHPKVGMEMTPDL